MKAVLNVSTDNQKQGSGAIVGSQLERECSCRRNFSIQMRQIFKSE